MKAQTRQTAPVEIAACEDAPPARASRRPPTTSNQDSFHSCFHLEGICYPHMGPRTLGRLREPSIREEPRGTIADGRLGRLLFSRLVINLGEVRVDDIFLVGGGSAGVAGAALRLRSNCFAQFDCRLR